MVHITIDGTPWCEYSGAYWVTVELGKLSRQERGLVTCGHVSMASARKAAKIIGRVLEDESRIKIISDECPTGAIIKEGVSNG